jgi:hypothetical protein
MIGMEMSPTSEPMRRESIAAPKRKREWVSLAAIAISSFLILALIGKANETASYVVGVVVLAAVSFRLFTLNR